MIGGNICCSDINDPDGIPNFPIMSDNSSPEHPAMVSIAFSDVR